MFFVERVRHEYSTVEQRQFSRNVLDLDAPYLHRDFVTFFESEHLFRGEQLDIVISQYHSSVDLLNNDGDHFVFRSVLV